MKKVYSLTCIADDVEEAYALLERYLHAGMLVAAEQTLEAVVEDRALKSVYIGLVQAGALRAEVTAPFTEASSLPEQPLYELIEDPLSREQHMQPTIRGRQMLRAELS